MVTDTRAVVIDIVFIVFLVGVVVMVVLVGRRVALKSIRASRRFEVVLGYVGCGVRGSVGFLTLGCCASRGPVGFVGFGGSVGFVRPWGPWRL